MGFRGRWKGGLIDLVCSFRSGLRGGVGGGILVGGKPNRRGCIRKIFFFGYIWLHSHRHFIGGELEASILVRNFVLVGGVNQQLVRCILPCTG